MKLLIKDMCVTQEQLGDELISHKDRRKTSTQNTHKLSWLRENMDINTTVSERLSSLTPQNINATNIQSLTKKDYNMWHELGRGKAILSKPYHLEQYFYSYGPMISKQWSELRQVINLNFKSVDIFDYGCGQGIGTANIFDLLRSGGTAGKQKSGQFDNGTMNRLNTVMNVNLIEPSDVALSRAKKLLNIYPTKSSFNPVNKKLNELAVDDLNYAESSTKIHIFSNILDIGSFDQIALLEKILSIKGAHYIVAVSPKNSDGGVRMSEIYNKTVRNYEAKSHQKWDLTYKTQVHNAFVAYLEV